jgi:hypothetical protein
VFFGQHARRPWYDTPSHIKSEFGVYMAFVCNSETFMLFWVIVSVGIALFLSILVDMYLLECVGWEDCNRLLSILEGGFDDSIWYPCLWFFCAVLASFALVLDNTTGILQDETWGDAIGSIIILFLCSRILFAWAAYGLIELCLSRAREVEARGVGDEGHVAEYRHAGCVPTRYTAWIIKFSLVASGVLGLALSLVMLLQSDFRWWRILYLTLPFNSFYVELYIWYPGAASEINNIVNRHYHRLIHRREYI